MSTEQQAGKAEWYVAPSGGAGSIAGSTYMWTTICPRCGGAHRLEACPQVKSIRFYPDGKIESVEFIAPPPAPIAIQTQASTVPDDVAIQLINFGTW